MTTTDHSGEIQPYAEVHVADTGISVSIRKPALVGGDTTDVAAFAWVDGVNVERWARAYASVLNTHAEHVGAAE